MTQKKIIGLFIVLLLYYLSSGHGRAYNFLVGYNALIDTFTLSPGGRLLFDSANVSVFQDTFKMKFMCTQANISDVNGNLLFYTIG